MFHVVRGELCFYADGGAIWKERTADDRVLSVLQQLTSTGMPCHIACRKIHSLAVTFEYGTVLTTVTCKDF